MKGRDEAMKCSIFRVVILSIGEAAARDRTKIDSFDAVSGSSRFFGSGKRG
jgi:hypothetical protein